jgi:Cytochrome bd terminal oxidase subunit II
MAVRLYDGEPLLLRPGHDGARLPDRDDDHRDDRQLHRDALVGLYPYVMVSSTNPASSLTAANSASNPYTLKVTTVIAVVLLPVVLAYEAWTYYVAAGPAPARSGRGRHRIWRGSHD